MDFHWNLSPLDLQSSHFEYFYYPSTRWRRLAGSAGFRLTTVAPSPSGPIRTP
uniref:Uncharacterized protein n=1 Tax=Cannabis sativa TaxID=3483 RepID=A0A803QSP6_CANSA